MEEMNAKLKETLAKTQQDLDTSKQMVIKKEGEILYFQRNKAEMEELNTELKQDLDASKLMVREKEDKIQYFQRNQAEMEEMNAKLKETLAKTQEDLDASNLMVTKKEGKIQYFQQIAMKSTNQRITNQAQMKEMNELKETLAKTQQDLDTAKQMVTKKEGEIQYLQRIAMSTNQRITNQAQMKEMNELKETLAKTQQDLDTAKQMMNRKDEQYEELKKETEGLRKQQSKDASRIAERDVEIQKLNSEIKMLKIKYREKAIDAQIQEDVNRKIHDELHNLRLHGRLYSSY
ncbi:CAP-Gly domain-containing linker protein 1-like isoform X1 [Saccostrea cucullata]|uniref:CAP-Gly domain-containing linker protein 1-like isoform X1 n=1 Tax=Saccostrea cuccullata TaxID=36930 RepID=UPI002ED53C27